MRITGKLAKKDLDAIEDGARVDLDEFEKDAVRDFALWEGSEGAAGWDQGGLVADGDRGWPAGVAPGVFGDGDEVSGR